MLKKLFCSLMAMMLVLSLASASVSAEEKVRVTALKGPTAMGLVKMMNDYPQDYDFVIEGSVDAITPKLVKQETDIAAVPANLAAVLYQKTQGEIQVLAVNTLGVLYLVESGDTVHSIEDLQGKTVYASGKGATPEYALNYLLKEYGLSSDDVTIEWKSEHSECLAALLANEGAVAMLPQPFVTSAQLSQESIRVAVDLNEAWNSLQASTGEQSMLITGVMVVRKAYAEEHPQEIQDFLSRYAESVNFTNQNTDEAAALIGQYEIVTEKVAAKALPYCSIVCISGDEMKAALSGYLEVLYEQNTAAVGGALPQEDFYYVNAK